MGVWTTAIKTWAAGSTVVAADMNAQIKDFASGFGAWTSYTPAWTASGSAPSLGNGTLTGSYLQVQKLVIAKAQFAAGSTSTFGTGTYYISLPVTAVSASGHIYGTGVVYDSSPAAFYTGVVRQNTTTKLEMVTDAGYVGQTSPITFAQNDEIRVLIVYEAA